MDGLIAHSAAATAGEVLGSTRQSLRGTGDCARLLLPPLRPPPLGVRGVVSNIWCKRYIIMSCLALSLLSCTRLTCTSGVQESMAHVQTKDECKDVFLGCSRQLYGLSHPTPCLRRVRLPARVLYADARVCVCVCLTAALIALEVDRLEGEVRSRYPEFVYIDIEPM